MTMMLKAALEYAKQGWPVFPCNPRTKAPITVRGHRDATLMPDVIRRMWCGPSNENSMIGVPTGNRIGAFVIDINPPAGISHEQMRRKIEQHVDRLPHTRTTNTPNGVHLWFKIPRGVEIRNRGKLLDGAIDCIRGEGGYVIVPPSCRYDGKHYGWANLSMPIQPAPNKLIELVRPVEVG